MPWDGAAIPWVSASASLVRVTRASPVSLNSKVFTLFKNAKTTLIMSDQSDANAGIDSKKAQPTRAASSRSGERDPKTSTSSNVADCHSTGKLADSHCKKSKKSKVSKSTESGRSPSNRSGRERSHKQPCGTSASSEKRTVTVELSQNGGGSGGQGNAGRQHSRSASPSHARSVLPDVASLIQAEMAKFAATMAHKRARSTSSSSDSSSHSSWVRGRSRPVTKAQGPPWKATPGPASKPEQ